ncbi:ABC transporter substrate-binding protein [Pseudaestuariivita rosea]|uniref:ABC transporter substrate-binding protein n=1 Tax=Pseudaestuariivita rosea TaxID=2763263 RepID=UPI001ABA8B66|nr:ABC transporter substrate-binding protein [Pseudaestuariivita rosea]
MLGFGRLSKAFVLLAGLANSAAADDGPTRVVSINLCTDQLALLLADDDQLISVSRLAHDPISSAMADQAMAFPTNSALAEEIYMLNPDLVLAGTFSPPATLSMLDRLGVRVERFEPAYSINDVTARMRQMGHALDRTDVADQQILAFETRLTRLQAEVRQSPRAALYYANGYTSGDKTLAGEILAYAGFQNIAPEAGLRSGGTLPLEQLLMLAPDIVISGEKYPAASRSEEILDHPVLDRLNRGSLTDRDWICGTPFVLNAIHQMAKLRERVTE